jgi:hypothetical protein
MKHITSLLTRNTTLGLALIVLLNTFQGYAQTEKKDSVEQTAALSRWAVGLEGLANKNYLITEVGYRNDTEYKPIGGYAYGVAVQYQLWPHVALATGIGWGQKNYQWQRTDYYEGTYTRYRNTFLQVPLLVQFSIPIVPKWPRLHAFAEGGIVAQNWLKKEAAYRLPSIMQLNEEGNDYPLNTIYDSFLPLASNGYRNADLAATDRAWQWQWQVAVGVQYRVGNYLTVYAKVARAEDITDKQSDNQQINRIAQHNRTYSAGAGVRVNLALLSTKVKKSETLKDGTYWSPTNKWFKIKKKRPQPLKRLK